MVQRLRYSNYTLHLFVCDDVDMYEGFCIKLYVAEVQPQYVEECEEM